MNLTRSAIRREKNEAEEIVWRKAVELDQVHTQAKQALIEGQRLKERVLDLLNETQRNGKEPHD